MADFSDDRLDSWKRIAAYLGRNERTAMRWAQRFGLPVHRTPGTHHGSVFAYRSEIDAWLAGRRVFGPGTSTEPNGSMKESTAVETPGAVSRLPKRLLRFRSKVQLALMAVIVTGFAFLLWANLSTSLKARNSAAEPVTRISFIHNAILAWNGDNQLWKHEFAHPVHTHFWGSAARISDFVRILNLDGGNKTEIIIVAPLRMGPNPDSPSETIVDCFSDKGKLLWSYTPHETFQFGEYTLRGPWYVTSLYASETGPNPSVWIAAEHYVWGNSFVVQLDLATGRPTLRFVNTGVVYALNEITTSSRIQLLVGGFNNEYSAGILAVINEKKSFAASPQTPGTRHQCVSCAPGVPDEYFVFPRTEINRVEAVYQDPVTVIQVRGDQVQVYKTEVRDPMGASTIYQFSAASTFRPVSLRYDSSYDILYRRLEKEGRIHYSLADSPERLQPQPVAVWMPSRGWAKWNFRSPGLASPQALPISKPPRYVLAAIPGQ